MPSNVKGIPTNYNLVDELLQFACGSGFKIFCVVCFDPKFQSFACTDEHSLDRTFKCVFSRIDRFAKATVPGELVKLVFDDRTHSTNKANAKAITNFLVKSPVGRGYDSILPYPLFAVSQGHNYGLQLADVLTAVVAMRFQGDSRVNDLWTTARQMIYQFRDGERRWSSLKVFE